VVTERLFVSFNLKQTGFGCHIADLQVVRPSIERELAIKPDSKSTESAVMVT